MTKTIQFITAILVFSLLITACEKDPIISEIHITDDITENTTWEAKYVYYVDQSINVTNNSILTIEPGTIIKFAQGKELDVSYRSSSTGNIIALGTEKAPILFTSQAQVKSKGDWWGVWLYEGADASEFRYCTFEYAGGSGWSGGEGAITINLAENVAIDNCTFKKSDSYGVRIYQSQSGLSSFTYNSFIDNTINDLKLYAYNVSYIGEGNMFSKDIDVQGSLVDAPGDVVWRKQNASYILINAYTEVGSITGTTLLIEAGASIQFSNFGMTIAYTSAKYGMIKAMGTATDPITITSAAANPSNGDWTAITFYDGSSMGSLFEYCNFSYGGGYVGAPAMIVFKFEQGSTTTINNCTFSDSEGYGIMLDQVNSDTNYPNLANNTFTNNILGDKNW